MGLQLRRVEEPFGFELMSEGGHLCTLDANVTIGGKGKGFRPMELLAGSLAGCASIDVLLILKKQRIVPTIFSIDIETKRVEAVPAIFEEIKLIFKVNEGIPADKLNKAIDLTLQKYCSVSACLLDTINVIFEVKFE
jgi:putative redox protein